ncbi:MAG: beta strand repeat-containing protein, partial [Aristaeellaceae bacterium]
INIDAIAQIEDGISFGEAGLGSLKAEADYKANFYIQAAAGSTGGTSVAPVMALTVSSVNTKALVGNLEGTVTEMSGDVVVTANTEAVRKLISDAKAVGSRAGVGAAVGLSILDDSAVAELNRSVKAQGVQVAAQSISRVSQDVYASAQGASPTSVISTAAPTDITIQQFIKLLSGKGDPEYATPSESMNQNSSAENINNKNSAALSNTAGHLNSLSGKKSSMTSESVASLANKRPSMQTTEGSVQVAAAIAANVHSNKTLASIADGVRIEATGDVRVTSLEDTDAVIYADATACNSTIGVGAAAAVNYVEYENKAYVGARSIKADNLIIRADVQEAENRRSVDEVINELLNYLADTETGRDILKKALLDGKEDKNSLLDYFTAEQQKQLLDEYNEKHGDDEQLTDAQKVENMIFEIMLSDLKGDPLGTVSSGAVALAESLLSDLADLLFDPSFLVDALLSDTAAISAIRQELDKKQMVVKVSMDLLLEAAVTELTAKYGNPSELENVGNRISTSAVSGAGAANVGVAGSLALTILDADAQAILSGLEAPDAQDKVELTGILELYAQSANKVYTTASSSAANNGLPIKNRTGKQLASKSVGVGASFAMADVDATAEAIVGENRTVTAGALSVEAIVHNDIDTVSVAGQDPIGRQQSFPDYQMPAVGQILPANQTSTKDIAVDASAALNIIKNTVTAAVNQGACLTLGGGNLISTARVLSTNDKGETVYEQANLYLHARQRGQTYATSSGFATGNTAAVGGSVAVNLSTSDVNAELDGEGEIRGRIIVDAETLNEDESQAFALTYGASLDRYFEKIRTVLSIANFTDNPSTGIINNKVMGKFNEISSPLYGKAATGIGNSPLMTMVLSVLGLNLPSAPAAENSTANNALAEAGAAAQTIEQFSSNTVNIAAAVGVNVTAHKAKALINGSFTAQSMDAKAENSANYRAYATGASVATSPNPLVNANVLSMGVAVSVNHNEADVKLAGNLNGTEGVAANAILRQNLDDRFAGLLAAQSLAGAVGSKGKGVGLAGAVSVVKTYGKSSAQILDGAVINGGDVVVKAVEKSKIAVRAGGLSAGTSTVGIGASFALIYDENVNLAKIGKDASVTAKSLEVKAEKQEVTADDYQFPFDLNNLFTVSDGSMDQTSPDNKGLIHLNISDSSTEAGGNEENNSIEVNLSTEMVMRAVDMLNYLASVNYYMESIAGTIDAGTGAKAAVSGAFSMLFANNATSAEIDEDAIITLDGGKATVEAKSGVSSRIIGGSLTATSAVGVGANIAGLDDRSKVNASVGNGTAITAGEDISVSAEAKNDVLAVTVAGVLSVPAADSTAAIGGTVNVILTGNEVNASVGDGAKLISENGSVSVLAKNLSDLILVSTSMNGAGKGIAAGGTFAAAVSGNSTYAKAGENAVIRGAKDVTIKAESEENLINVLASASGSGTDESAAGIIGVLVSQSDTEATVGDHAVIEAKSGAVNVLAQGDVKQIVAMAAIAGSGGQLAAGATVNVGVFEQTVAARVGSGVTLKASGLAAGSNVNVLASGRSQTILLTAAGSATTGSAIAGTIPVVISQSKIITEIGDNSVVSAGDSIAIASDAQLGLYNAAGNMAIGGGTVGVGATVSTMVVQNEVLTTIGNNVTLRASAVGHGGVRLPNRSDKRRGVILSANADTQLLMASVSGAAGIGTAGVCGVVNTLVIKNTVKVTVGENGVIEAGFSEEDSQEASGDDAEAAIESSDETHIYNLAGGISVGGSAGVGTTVVTMVYDKTLEASVGVGGSIRASGSIQAAAESSDDVYLLALSFAGGGTAGVGVGVGASALAFENDLLASLGGSVTAKGNVDVTAKSSTDLFNVAAALAGSGSAAVTPVAVVTWFDGSTVAEFAEGASIQAGGNVTLAADSMEFISSDAAGVSGSGAASVSGTVDILISDQVTRAQAQKNVSITAKQLDISALDDSQILAIAATGAFSGAAAVGVTAVVSVLHNTVTAGFLGGEAGKNDIVIDGSVNVLADAKRDVLSYAGSAAVSGGAGVGTTIMVTVAGGKLSQDSSDALLRGFDPDGFVNDAFDASGSYTEDYRMDGLDDKLAGDGVKQSDIQLGDDDGNFDAESGYVSEDFQNSEEVTAENANRGENFEVNEKNNADLSEAAAITAAKYDPKSAVTAVIGSGVSITAGGDIYVLSDELVSSDMIAGAAAGGIAGVSPALAVNVVYSNVIAGVDDGAVLSADGQIQIQANSGTVEKPEGSDSGEQERNDGISELVKDNDDNNKLDLSSRTIRSIAVVGSGGVAGVSVSGSVVVLSNNTIAYLNAAVAKAAALSVTAGSDYPSILC